MIYGFRMFLMQFLMILSLKWLSAVASFLLSTVEEAAWTQHFQQSVPSCTGTSVIPCYLPSWRAEERKSAGATSSELCHGGAPQSEHTGHMRRPCSVGNRGAHGTVWPELLAAERALGGPAWSKSFHTLLLSFNRLSTPRIYIYLKYKVYLKNKVYVFKKR